MIDPQGTTEKPPDPTAQTPPTTRHPYEFPTNTSAPTTPTPTYRWSRTRRILLRGTVAAASTIAAYTIWYLWCRTFGPRTIDITRLREDSVRVRWQEIVAAAVLFTCAGWAVLAYLERYTPSRARMIFGIIGGATLAASFAPVLLEHATIGTRVVLSGLHLAVGLPTLFLTPRIGRRGGHRE